jgi:hypothetical protein
VNYVVGDTSNKANPQRWMWNGITMRPLRSQDDFNAMRFAFPFAVGYDTLANPYWMDPAEIAYYLSVTS